MKTTIDNKTIITPKIPYSSAIIIDGKRTYNIEIEIGQSDAGFIQDPINMEVKLFLLNGTYILLEKGVDYVALIIQNGLHIILLQEIPNADYFIFARRTRADFIIDFTEEINGPNLKKQLNNVFDETFYILQELRLDADLDSVDISNKVDKINVLPQSGGSTHTIPIIITNNQGQVLSIQSVQIAILSDQVIDLEETVDNYSFIKAKADKTYVDAQDATKIDKSSIGIAGGVTPLDLTRKVPAEFLPTRGESLKGEWNASTNDPLLSDANPNNKNGDYYKVIEEGTQDLGHGPIDFEIGDEIMYSSDLGAFFRIPASTANVISVNGKFGVVVLNTDNIEEGSLRQYFTTGKAKNATLTDVLSPTEEELAPVSSVVYNALLKKANLIIDATTNNIVITDSTGQSIDSGKKFDNDPMLGTNLDTNIPTQKAVKTYIDTKDTDINDKINNKVDKINILSISISDSSSTFSVKVNTQGQVVQINSIPISISVEQITDFINTIDLLLENKVDKVIPTIDKSIAALNFDGNLYNTNTIIKYNNAFVEPKSNEIPTTLEIKNYIVKLRGGQDGLAPLDNNTKIPPQYLYDFAGDQNFKGFYDALTDTPHIESGIGLNGDYYIVNVAGQVNIDEITYLGRGDRIIFDGSSNKWRKFERVDSGVDSVNGNIGPHVELTLDQIPDGFDRKLLTKTEVESTIDNKLLPYASINSPVFGGNPTAPTPNVTDDSNRLATTDFVNSKIIASQNKKYGMDINNRSVIFLNTVYIAQFNGTFTLMVSGFSKYPQLRIFINGILIGKFGDVNEIDSIERNISASWPIAIGQSILIESPGVTILKPRSIYIVNAYLIPFLS